jgi:hypothetical protein
VFCVLSVFFHACLHGCGLGFVLTHMNVCVCVCTFAVQANAC